jgi:hypothetical protein
MMQAETLFLSQPIMSLLTESAVSFVDVPLSPEDLPLRKPEHRFLPLCANGDIIEAGAPPKAPPLVGCPPVLHTGGLPFQPRLW